MVGVAFGLEAVGQSAPAAAPAWTNMPVTVSGV
jgi:hypothetical protein